MYFPRLLSTRICEISIVFYLLGLCFTIPLDSIQGFVLNGTRTLYVSELFSFSPNQGIMKNYFAYLNAFEFVFTTGGPAVDQTDISVWGKGASGQLVAAHRLASSELLRAGAGVFAWGAETISIWADSNGEENPFQAAITAATSSPLTVTFGTSACLLILIAANSSFDRQPIGLNSKGQSDYRR